MENKSKRKHPLEGHGDIYKFTKKRDSEAIKKYLITSGLCRSIEDLNASNLLFSFVDYNLADSTEYLLSLGCDMNIQDPLFRDTPLISSVRMHHVATIKILLSAGADILALNAENTSALHMLSDDWIRSHLKSTIGIFLEQLKKQYSSNEELATKLIASNHHLSHVAVLGDSEIIERMIQQNSPIDFIDMIYTQSTAMHMAVLLSHSKIVKVLLKYHADVNAVDAKYGRTPLYNLYKNRFESYCAERYKGKLETLKAFLRRGASITTCTFEGVFQAQNVLINGNEEAIEILIDSGLDCNVKDIRDERNILHYLARNSYLWSKKEWLKVYIKKFDVNSRDEFGKTPLFIATAEGNSFMCEILLKFSARTDLKDDIHHMTPLQYAYACEDDEFKCRCYGCGEILLMYNADPQIVILKENGEEVTIFDAALQKNDFERIKPIVAHIAILEKRGTTITEIIRSRINSHDLVKNYSDKCRNLLTERISGRVLLFDLLTSDKRKIARYLSNENIVRLLENVRHDDRLKHCSYYGNFLNRLLFKGRRYKDLKHAAAGPLCKIFQDRIGKTHIIIDIVTDYLNNQSLRRLAEI